MKTTNVRYYDPKTKGLDFKGFIEDLKASSRRVLVPITAHMVAQPASVIDMRHVAQPYHTRL